MTVVKCSFQICGEEMGCKLSMYNHTKRHAHKASLFNCSICKKSFWKKETLERHKERHKKPGFACSKCPKKFMSKFTLRTHIKVSFFLSSYTFMKSWRGYIFIVVCRSVCVFVCVRVSNCLSVNNIPAERMHPF